MDRRRHYQQLTSNSIPDQRDHPIKYAWVVFKWRASVAAVTHPVQLALVVALIVCALPIWMVLDQAGTIRDQQREIQASRVVTSRVFCEALNRNSGATNIQTDYIKGLILAGAKASLIFEPIYRQYGAPSYAERLKQADEQARRLDVLKISTVDCRELVKKVGKTGVP